LLTPSGFTIWADEVGLDATGQELLTVRQYRGKKFLSTSSTVTPIDDLDRGPIEEESGNDDAIQHLKNIRIVGVQKLDTYY
jgi:hypothetical protein